MYATINGCHTVKCHVMSCMAWGYTFGYFAYLYDIVIVVRSLKSGFVLFFPAIARSLSYDLFIEQAHTLHLDQVMALKRSLDDSPWGYEFQLYGTHFHHANERALVTTFGISLVATFGIAIRAIFVRRNNRPLRWGILAFSILLSIM